MSRGERICGDPAKRARFRGQVGKPLGKSQTPRSRAKHEGAEGDGARGNWWATEIVAHSPHFGLDLPRNLGRPQHRAHRVERPARAKSRCDGRSRHVARSPRLTRRFGERRAALGLSPAALSDVGKKIRILCSAEGFAGARPQIRLAPHPEDNRGVDLLVDVDQPTPAATTDAPGEEGARPIPPLAADEPRRRDAAELIAALAAEAEED
jgi:hypothetical protein